MLYKLCRILASSKIFFYLLLWLMVLLVAGTIAEHNQGLYYAQKNYFSVYFFFIWGFIPLPGTYAVLSAIFINLLCKLIIDTWSIKKLGSIITHVSGLLLLLGGFLTANFSYEGYIDLEQNKTINYISDYNKLELAIDNITFADQDLSIDNILSKQNLDFNIHIIEICKHCETITNQDNIQYLKQLPKPKDNEQPSTIIKINLLDKSSNKKINVSPIFLKLNNKSAYQINHNNKIYNITLRHQRYTLPFSINLNKFNSDFYPGTEIARGYESDVTLADINNKNNKWHSVISMNNPLRYKGFTLYQSSYYLDDNNNYTSVLAVVYNIGQSFPYIASIILCIGILIHLVQRLPRLVKR